MMLEQMKRIARQTGQAGAPVRLLFGEVTQAQPLTVRVDGRFLLSGAALVVLRQGHTHQVPVGMGEATSDGGTLDGLQPGDKMALLRDEGGQRYLVLGRV